MEKERREREEAVKMTTLDRSIGENCSAEEMGLAIVPFQGLQVCCSGCSGGKVDVIFVFCPSFVFVFHFSLSGFSHSVGR